MINITLIAVGKLKEKYLRDAVDEYSKRLGAFCKINIIEIDEEKIGDNPSSAQIQNVIEKEGQRIIKKIPKSSNIISLCIEGKEYSSPDFSKLIENISMTSSSICFIIGGSFGLSDEVKKLSNYKLSFGKMTLPRLCKEQHLPIGRILFRQIFKARSFHSDTAVNIRACMIAVELLLPTRFWVLKMFFPSKMKALNFIIRFPRKKGIIITNANILCLMQWR